MNCSTTVAGFFIYSEKWCQFQPCCLETHCIDCLGLLLFWDEDTSGGLAPPPTLFVLRTAMSQTHTYGQFPASNAPNNTLPIINQVYFSTPKMFFLPNFHLLKYFSRSLVNHHIPGESMPTSMSFSWMYTALWRASSFLTVQHSH